MLEGLLLTGSQSSGTVSPSWKLFGIFSMPAWSPIADQPHSESELLFHLFQSILLTGQAEQELLRSAQVDPGGGAFGNHLH